MLENVSFQSMFFFHIQITAVKRNAQIDDSSQNEVEIFKYFCKM